MTSIWMFLINVPSGTTLSFKSEKLRSTACEVARLVDFARATRPMVTRLSWIYLETPTMACLRNERIIDLFLGVPFAPSLRRSDERMLNHIVPIT